MDERARLGRAGEDAAARHLADRGLEILDRNFRTAHGELDIVAAGDDCLVFCEVRARLGRRGTTSALESVGPAKRRQLRRMAAEWFRSASRARRAAAAVRFDVIAIALARDGAVVGLEHVEDAF